MSQRSLLIGLTGGIASGKSAVANIFSSLGVPVINADVVARQVVEPGEPCLSKVADFFGPTILKADGSLDRRALRSIIFSDSGKRQALENLLHPEIARRIREWLDNQTAPYVILESPLLLETDQHQWVDRVLVVDVAEELQISRTMARDNCDRSQAKSILDAQMPRHIRLQKAQDVITNNGGLDDLGKQVSSLHETYLELGRRRRPD